MIAKIGFDAAESEPPKGFSKRGGEDVPDAPARRHVPMLELLARADGVRSAPASS